MCSTPLLFVWNPAPKHAAAGRCLRLELVRCVRRFKIGGIFRIYTRYAAVRRQLADKTRLGLSFKGAFADKFVEFL